MWDKSNLVWAISPSKESTCIRRLEGLNQIPTLTDTSKIWVKSILSSYATPPLQDFEHDSLLDNNISIEGHQIADKIHITVKQNGLKLGTLITNKLKRKF